MLGFLFIDKPQGMSSFDVVRKLRKICGMRGVCSANTVVGRRTALRSARRMGFVGTLDPLATGLMIVALGEATKMLHFLEGLDKKYEVMIHLGATSDTYDAAGKITPYDQPKKPFKDAIQQVLTTQFVGEQQQQPPIFSAIHVNGERAYDLARKGEKVELKKRTVHFYDVKLVSYKWPLLQLSVHCSSGTYIRSLAHDLGQILKCGGYVETLRRTEISNFSLQKAVLLKDLTPENVPGFLLPLEEIFPEWHHINLESEQYEILAQGGFIVYGKPNSLIDQPLLAFYQGQCVGILEWVDSSRPHRLKFLKKFILS